jgi:ClpP class serine protease
LASDEIIMSEHAVLGPVDPQLGKYPAASVLKVIKRKPVAEIEDETLILADQAEKAIIQLRESVQELLNGKPANGRGPDELARILSEGTWTHDYPINYDRAKALGLPVRADIHDDVLKLMSLYPQPTRSQPSVEYLPGPRSRRPSEAPAVNP